MKNIILNIILFQVGWFACVLTAANNIAAVGALISVMILITHVKLSVNARKEIRIISIAMLIGLVWDSILVSTGLLNYQSGMVASFLAPYWIVLMWALFATTINSSLAWLKEKLIIAAIFGAISGPLAYYAGAKLGAVVFVSETNALIALSVGWAIFTPLLLLLSSTNDNQGNVAMEKAL